MSVGSNGPTSVKNDINVTPLIDVLLVLLIIFLVIIPIMMKMETLQVPRKDDDSVPPPEASQLTITVKVDGSMAFFDGTTEVPIAAADVARVVRPKLEALHIGIEKVVFVDYEGGVPWRNVVSTMDSIRSLASDSSHDEIKVALKVKDP